MVVMIVEIIFNILVIQKGNLKLLVVKILLILGFKISLLEKEVDSQLIILVCCVGVVMLVVRVIEVGINIVVVNLLIVCEVLKVVSELQVVNKNLVLVKMFKF